MKGQDEHEKQKRELEKQMKMEKQRIEFEMKKRMKDLERKKQELEEASRQKEEEMGRKALRQLKSKDDDGEDYDVDKGIDDDLSNYFANKANIGDMPPPPPRTPSKSFIGASTLSPSSPFSPFSTLSPSSPSPDDSPLPSPRLLPKIKNNIDEVEDFLTPIREEHGLTQRAEWLLRCLKVMGNKEQMIQACFIYAQNGMNGEKELEKYCSQFGINIDEGEEELV